MAERCVDCNTKKARPRIEFGDLTLCDEDFKKRRRRGTSKPAGREEQPHVLSRRVHATPDAAEAARVKLPKRSGPKAITSMRELREAILAGAAGDTMPEALSVGPFGRLELFAFHSDGGGRIGKSARHTFWHGEGLIAVHDDPRLYGGRTPARDRPRLDLAEAGLNAEERAVVAIAQEIQGAGQQRWHAVAAERLGLTERQVRTRFESANRKILLAIAAQAEARKAG